MLVGDAPSEQDSRGLGPTAADPAPPADATLTSDATLTAEGCRAPGPTVDQSEGDRRRIRRSSVLGVVLGAIPFLLVLGDLGVRPTRTAVGRGIFSDFYDLQARALLDGRLDVAPGSLAIEAFVIDGRHYMYFPPFPALLRIPIFIVTDRFDGRLTAMSMLVAWVVTAVMTVVLVWRVRHVLRPGAPVGRLEAGVAAILVATVTGGSVLVFVASLPWVYHEAYAWSTAAAIGTLACLIGALTRPTGWRIVAVGAFALATILTRMTAGWALGLAVVAAGSWLLIGRYGAVPRSRAVWLLAAGVLTIVVGGGVNWLKFRHPFMFPLERQVWTDLNAHRREALEVNGGHIAGPQFFPSALFSYFRPDGTRFVPYFPYITLPREPAPSVGGAFLDQTYRTGSVPAYMPLLFLSTIWGAVVVFGRRASAGARLLRIPFVGALAVTGGVMFYGYIAHRYTVEFLPVLVLGSAVGLLDVARRLELATLRTARLAIGVVVALALYGAAANLAVGVVTARQSWRGDRLRDLVTLQTRMPSLGGDHVADLVVRADDALPRDAPADRLAVIGECRSVYLASGETFEPWIPVEVRELHAEVAALRRRTVSGTIAVARFEGRAVRTLWVDAGERGRVRLRLRDGPWTTRGEWFVLRPGDRFDVVIRAVPQYDVLEIDAGPRFRAFVPLSEWDEDWYSVPTLVRGADPSPALQAQLGLQVSESLGPRSDLCARLVGRDGDG